MTIEVALVISSISLAFGIYQGMSNIKRNQKSDDKKEATQLTTVIVKLENIGTGISEIKNEMLNLKSDVRNDHDKLIKVESIAKSVRSRMNLCERNCKRFSKPIDVGDADDEEE